MSYSASQSRQIHFTSKGGGYSAIWMSSRGDLYQEYLQSGSDIKYYPNISSSTKVTMHLTVTSARTQGTVTPASVKYYANGTELVFNTAGACTTTGMTSVFHKNASGELEIIGNLGNVTLGSFLLEAVVSMSSTSGTDTIHVSAPVTLLPYTGAESARVTIAPGDNQNFTISEKGGSCVLKALTMKGGQDITSGLTYEWYKFTGGAFVKLTTTTQTLKVNEPDVDTYSLYKVIVKENGAELGFDTQGVLDASDPYDIIISSSFNPGTTGANSVSTNDLTLDDEMADTAYLEFTCQFVKRGQTTAVAGTQAFVFTVVAGNGLQVFHPETLSGNKCQVKVSDLKQYGSGVGDYEIIAEGTFTPATT